MSVKLAALAALALAGQQIVIPFGKPPPPLAPTPPALANNGPKWAATCAGEDGWDTPAPPVRLYGNSYYVGTCGIAAILITSPQGHILIDSGTDKGAAVVAANIVALGFKLSDVRFLTHSHEHIDHVGGLSRMKALTGAKLVASPAAARVLATGKVAADDPQFGAIDGFEAVPVDIVANDGDTIRIGDVTVTGMATPGHTAGAMSWRWKACEASVCKTIVYADSLNPISADGYKFSAHPAALKAYRAALDNLAAVEPCDLLVSDHPGASNLPDRFAGKALLIDPAGCRTYAAAKAKALDERLTKEAAK